MFWGNMMAMETSVIDLIVPARDEEQNITALLEALPGGLLRHVIVVDNGSRDQTAAMARAGGAVVVSEPQRGYGAACLAGLAWIERQELAPTAVAFIDADLADDPAGLPRLCAPILADEAELVLGTRQVAADQRGALDSHQRLGNWLACWLIGLTTARRYRDLGPMRAVRWESLKRLGMADRTWGWTVEMQFKAARLKLRITELDVPYRKRRAGKSKISGSVIGSVRAGAKIISTIAVLWWRTPLQGHHDDA
jgi:glycosyltransferase involved in cell wall biosynthesis